MWRALALRMGLPLRLLKRVMTRREFLGWCEYFAQQPFDDERCFDLPAALLRKDLRDLGREKGSPPADVTTLLPFRPPPTLDETLLKVL